MADIVLVNGERVDLSVLTNSIGVSTITITRPNDTTAYAAGDVVEDSTSAPTAFSFDQMARFNGGSGTILSAYLYDSANQATKGQFELWLFSGTYGADNDNAVFTPTDAETRTVAAILQFNTAYVGDATSGAGGNAVYPLTGLNIPYVCPSTSQSLAAALVVRNAYTPVAQEVFVVKLVAAKD